jgi:hypothetical protein
MTAETPTLTAAGSPASKLESRIRISAILLIIGLVIEGGTLMWAHPTAFLAFAFIGCAFMGLGMLIFLYSLVSADRDHSS